MSGEPVVITNILRDINGMEQNGGLSTDSRSQGTSTFHGTSTKLDAGTPIVRILEPAEPLPRLLEANLFKLHETCSILTNQW
jgi:hypothetical protein